MATTLQLVAEEGYNSTSMQRIADEMGMSKAGILHHFSSRDALMLEVLRRRSGLVTSEVAAIEDPIEAAVDVTANNARQPGLAALSAVVTALSAADLEDSDRRGYIDGRYRRLRQSFTEAFRRAQDDGEVVSTVEPEVLAALLVAVMEGMQLQWLLDPDLTMSEHVRAFLTLTQRPESED